MLPQPDLIAQQHSAKVSRFIADKILSQGPITFAEYMQTVLYQPGLGYYVAGTHKFGRGGDFITAPEVSPLFAQCLARQSQQILTELGGGDILEFGAGSGQLAVDLLTALNAADALPQHYYILELSPELRDRQQALLQRHLPQFFSRICWIDHLPLGFEGVMIANEVLDAMPVHRFCWANHGLKEYYVDYAHSGFVDLLQPASAALTEVVAQLSLPTEISYHSEINLNIPGWMQSLASSLEKGAILLLDYGYPRHEYYHPERCQGTLMCHYQHYAHTDPYWWPGLQDITAHVEFTAVALAGQASQLELAGFNTQAHFLLSCGITELAEPGLLQENGYLLSQQLKKLLLPTQMGEAFKVMGFTKKMTIPLLGFQLQDRRDRLF
ncbi:MAG: SAM-dependent methyltransferase [Gammaproteobacteria bacterium]